jgi:hypothetical protein
MKKSVTDLLGLSILSSSIFVSGEVIRNSKHIPSIYLLDLQSLCVISLQLATLRLRLSLLPPVGGLAGPFAQLDACYLTGQAMTKLTNDQWTLS